jgi:hypothetical protein
MYVRGLCVDLTICVCLNVCDHVRLRVCVNVTWVFMCALGLCVILCVRVCMWVAECVYTQASEQGSK